MASGEPVPQSTFLRTYVYASPDGEDCLRKAFHCTKLAGFIGLYASIYDVVGITRPKGFMAVSGRMLMFGAPAAAAGATFAVSSCLLGDFRQKNDYVNHAFGGALAGAILGPRIRGLAGGVSVSLLLAGLAALAKYAKDEGVTILNHHARPREQLLKGGIFGARNRLPEPTDY